MKHLLALVLATLFAGNLWADLAGDFSTANEFYARGKYAEAATAYDKLLGTGVQSPALWFNLANAEFKTGNLGRAIAAYRHAALLSPRDAEIRANLQFVRNQIQGATIRESRWRSWLGTLSLGEWTILTAMAFWLTLGLLTARQLRPALAARLKTATRLLVALTLGAGTVLGVQAAGHYSARTAVVITPSAQARSGPFDDAQTAFTPHDGAELSVLDRHDQWLQVADGAGKSGWLPLTSVEVLPGA